MIDLRRLAYRSMVIDYRRMENGMVRDMTGCLYRIDYLDKMINEFEYRNESHRCLTVMGVRGKIELGIK